MAIAYYSLKTEKKPATVTTYDSRKDEAEIQLQGNNYSVTDHFSGPGTAIGPVCVCCVCLYVRTITF